MKVVVLVDSLGVREDDQKLITSFLDRGHQVGPIDWKLAQDKDFKNSLVLIRTPWDYAESSEDFFKTLEHIDKNNKLLNPLSVVRWNMDKKYLEDFYHKGISVLRTKLFQNFSFANLDEIFEEFTSEVVIKPRIGAGGINTFRFKKEDEKERLSALIGTDVLVQPFAPNIVSQGEYSFIFFNGKFSHSVLKVAKEGEFRVQDDHGGSVYAYAATESEKKEVFELLQSLDISSVYARVDVVKDQNKFVLMELEVIEPELFFRFSDNGEKMLVDAIDDFESSLQEQ